MKLRIRIYNRFVREYFRMCNLSYLKKFNKIIKYKEVVKTHFTSQNHYSRTHIPKTSEINTFSEKHLVIHIPYGGLGDHLFYTHIPRIAKESGLYSKVFLSKKSAIRNQKHLTYLWDKNPFFDGYSELENLHDYNNHLISNFDESKGNILDQIMLSYGLDDNNRWHEPELYFDVPLFPELFELTLYDPNFISYSGGLTSKKIEFYFKKNNYNIDFQFPVRSNSSLPITDFNKIIIDESFEDFCGIIISCKRIITLTTGTATLAAALKKPCIVILGNKLQTYYLHSKYHKYTTI